jgi:hypothetical protein
LSTTHGTLTGTAPSLTYIPAADYSGPDSLTFVANDGHANSEPAVVSIDVTPVNDPPVASPQSLSTAEDTPLDILLAASDPDGDPLTYTVTLTPGHGTLTGTAPALIYVPEANYYGADSLLFAVNDGQLDSEQAAVNLDVTSVNDAPVAAPQSVTARSGAAVALTLSGSDVEGDLLTYSVVTEPQHGSLIGKAPDLTYTSAAGYAGADAFTFVTDDGELTSVPATVTITVRFALYLPVVVK